jgi:hypothetical protein
VRYFACAILSTLNAPHRRYDVFVIIGIVIPGVISSNVSTVLALHVCRKVIPVLADNFLDSHLSLPSIYSALIGCWINYSLHPRW